MGIWAKRHQEAATALGNWAASNSIDAAALLNVDCSDRKQFKKKINDALAGSNQQQETTTQQSGYDVSQHNYHYGNAPARGSSSRGSSSRGGSSKDGFADWCKKYPRAAKKLRGHARALCKVGLGILSGAIK